MHQSIPSTNNPTPLYRGFVRDLGPEHPEHPEFVPSELSRGGGGG